MSSSLVPKMTSSTMPTAAASSAVSRAHPKWSTRIASGAISAASSSSSASSEQDQDEAQPDGVGHPQRRDDRREEGVQDADQRCDEDGAPEAGDRDAGHQPPRDQERERAEEPRQDQTGGTQAGALRVPPRALGGPHTLTGNVATQATAPRKTAHATASSASPDGEEAQPRGDARERERGREEHHRQHVPLGALDVGLDLLAGRDRLGLEPVGLLERLELVLGERERRRGRLGVLRAAARRPSARRRGGTRRGSAGGRRRRARLALGVGVDPLREGRDVDLDLTAGQARRTGRLDAGRRRAPGGERLVAVPLGGLIARPGRRHGRQREQDGRGDLDHPLLPVRGHGRRGAPRSSQGGGAVSPTTARCCSSRTRARSIAVGSSPAT